MSTWEEEECHRSHLPCKQQVPLGWGWGQAGATINGPLLEKETKSLGESGFQVG